MGTGPLRREFSNKIQHHRIAVAATVAGLLTLSILSFFWALSHHSHADFATTDSTDTLSSSPLFWQWIDAGFSAVDRPAADRPVFPYSVIPGGVRNKQELLAAAQQDPLVAQHYSDFRTHSAHVIRLAANRRVFVSYRLGDRIYWTRNKVTLHAGETLLTDGNHLARTRCGNRISETPVGPRSPAEPPVEVFNRPVGPRSPQFSPVALPSPPLFPEAHPDVLLALNSPASGTDWGVPIIPFFPFPIVPGGPSSSKPTPPPLPQPGPLPSPSPGPTPLPQPFPAPPPVATPEPRTLVLLIVGLAGLISVWVFRKF